MLTRLDNALLRAAQWTVDRIGGDYMGQRIARALGIATNLGVICLVFVDYRITGARLVILSLACCFNIWLIHCEASKAMEALYRGFANPKSGDVLYRLFILLNPVVPLFLPPYDWLMQSRIVLMIVYALGFYFLATDNPPPKKAEAKEDVTSLKPAFEQP